MNKIKILAFVSALLFVLSGCGIFGGSDGQDVSMAEDVDPEPTVNNVQSVPASTPDTGAGDTATEPEETPEADDAGALPTAVTLPTAAPTPEPTVDRSQPTTYIVQSGDVLSVIAERFEVDIAELRQVNDLDGNLIRVGQELTIPAADGSTDTDSGDTASGSSGSGETASGGGDAAPAPTSPPTTVSCNSTAAGHCVQPGESLLGIALKYDVTVEALRAANPGISGDLIRSGEVLNLPGSSGGSGGTTPTPAATTAPGATPDPAATVAPTSDADCAARNPDFPYFHASDGLCYANPIGATTVPTAVGSDGGDNDGCPEGTFLWEDGLCYPIPGVTVTPTAGPTPTADSSQLPDYGTVPCRDGYVPLESGRCWPEPETTPATVVPAATATATSSSNTVACADPYFVTGSSGTCFLLQEGADVGCSVENGVPKCPDGV